MSTSINKTSSALAFILGAGAGTGAALFIPWSLCQSSDPVVSDVSVQETQDNNEATEFEQAFKEARSFFGRGGVFEFNGNLYSTYYKEEWDNISTKNKQHFLQEASQINSETGEKHFAPVATGLSDDMDTGDAFIIAREEVGPGGIYFLNENIYGTYTIDEINNLPENEHNYINTLYSEMNIKLPLENLDNIEILDYKYDESINCTTDLDPQIFDDPDNIIIITDDNTVIAESPEDHIIYTDDEYHDHHSDENDSHQRHITDSGDDTDDWDIF
jgi:hypothetical protein